MKRFSTFPDLTSLYAAHSSILISHRFTPHARSWPHNASRPTLDLDFAARVSHSAMSGTPLKGNNPKYFFQNSSLLLLKIIESLNRLTTYSVLSHSQYTGTKIKHKSKTNTRLLRKRKYRLGLKIKRSWLDVPIIILSLDSYLYVPHSRI